MVGLAPGRTFFGDGWIGILQAAFRAREKLFGLHKGKSERPEFFRRPHFAEGLLCEEFHAVEHDAQGNQPYHVEVRFNKGHA